MPKTEQKGKMAKKDDASPDVSMAASGTKRAAEQSSGSSMGDVSPPLGPEVDPAIQAVMTQMLATFTASVSGQLATMKVDSERQYTAMSTSVTGALSAMTDRIKAHEDSSKAQFEAMDLKIQQITKNNTIPATFASVAASSAGPAAPLRPNSTNSTSPTEDCLVFIRGFPTTQPGFVLKGYADEALELLPTEERKAVRVRVSPADFQFSLVFPTSHAASTFVDAYRASNFVYTDADKVETPLTCRTGKPIALRRRGGAIRPVYSELEDVLRDMPTMKNAEISQSSKPRSGVWHTDFFVLKGRILTPLFSLTFKEDPEATTIVEMNPPPGGSPLSVADFARIKADAMPQ